MPELNNSSPRIASRRGPPIIVLLVAEKPSTRPRKTEERLIEDAAAWLKLGVTA
jgi:hypothetical protein